MSLSRPSDTQSPPPFLLDAHSLISSMSDGIVAVDPTGTILLCNDAFIDLFELDRFLIGEKLSAIFAKSTFGAAVQFSIQGAELTTGEYESPTRGMRVISVRSTPLILPQHDLPGSVIVFADVTQIRRLETIRQEFVANVSHELKTPITAIIGFAETLLSGSVVAPQDSQRYMGIIARQAYRLKRIVDDLLKLSRLEQDLASSWIDTNTENLSDILTSATELAMAAVEEKGILIDINCDPSLRAQLNASLFEQAIVNLIDNAIKYSPEGGRIVLSSRVVRNEVYICVQDFGSGIEPVHLPRLFERFYRVDKGRSRELGGTGLGLAIVKHVVQIHRGRVFAESQLGVGTTFTIALPMLAPGRISTQAS